MNKEIIEKYIQFAIDNGMKFLVKEKIGFYTFEYHTFFVKADSFKFINDFEIKVEYNKAIANKNVEYAYHDIIGTDYINIIELITSKEFIEAVARGLDKVDINSLHGGKIYITRLRWFFIGNYDSPNLIDTITHKQADAIRDNKLEEFINNLINYEKLKIF